MKKRKNFLALALLGAGILSLCACQSRPGQSHGGLTPVTLNEVAHSIFYAPSMQPLNWDILKKKALT